MRSVALSVVVLLLAASTVHAAADAHHARLTLPRGPVHVWTPAGYDAETAGVIVYVHGFYTTVDRAWRDHQLARQFAESGVNAMYIVCGAPTGPRSRIVWPSFTGLLRAVDARLGGAIPRGPRIAIGHSGAHRTLSAWTREEGLDSLVLIDAVYGDLDGLRAWVHGADDRRLIDVGNLSRRWSDQLHAALPETVIYDEFPSPDAGKLPGARQARIVYVRSEIGHMPLVTGGHALPMILRALRLELVATSSRDAPIRTWIRRQPRS